MTVIARLALTGRQAGTPDVAISVEIGVPYEVGEGGWACPVSVQPLHERLPDIHGAESFQALLLAMRLALHLLENYTERGGALFLEDGDAFPFDAYVMNFGRGNRLNPAP